MLKLVQLTKENVQQFTSKSVCVFEPKPSYFSELIEEFDFKPDVKLCIKQVNKKRQKMGFDYYQTNIQVFDYSYIKDIDITQYTLLITDGYYKEVFEKVQHTLGEDIEMNVYFYANHDTKLYLQYKEKYKNNELEDIIIFRSGPAAGTDCEAFDFTDNSKALFDYMIVEGYNEKYELVWLVNYPEKYKDIEKIHNVKFLSVKAATTDKIEERDEYYRVLCLAKYIFTTDAYGFAREARETQVRVQLWHGCGFKTRINFVACGNRYEYTTVISNLYSDIHKEIFGLCDEQMLVTGYAKQDWVFNGCDMNLKKQMNISDNSKIILWLPTFRKSVKSMSYAENIGTDSDTGLPLIYDISTLQALNEYLKSRNVVIIIKTHPIQDDSVISIGNLSNIQIISKEWLISERLNINQLFSQTDALISDYSSGAVDYMLADKPMAFTLDDVEEYEASRGFVFDNICEWLPGKEIRNYDDMCEFVDMISAGEDYDREKRRSLRAKMHKYNDGNSCRRIIEALGIER